MLRIANSPDSALPGYAELHCLSNFSFQRGASHGEELVARAQALGYTALAITDECSVAGVVRSHVEAKKRGLKLLPGAEFRFAGPDVGRGAGPEAGGFKLVALAHNLAGWGNLCEFITAARRRAAKGTYSVTWDEVAGVPQQHSDLALLRECQILLVFSSAINIKAAYAVFIRARGIFGSKLWLLAELQFAMDDGLLLHRLQQASQLTAAGNSWRRPICRRSRQALHQPPSRSGSACRQRCARSAHRRSALALSCSYASSR